MSVSGARGRSGPSTRTTAFPRQGSGQAGRGLAQDSAPRASAEVPRALPVGLHCSHVGRHGRRPGAIIALTRRLMRRDNRGQMAVMFLVFIALILAMAAMTMNLGEVAKLKTTTANAADAGALAAASWVASGENEAGLIAQGIWLNWLITFLIFLLPFCIWACLTGVLIALRYALVQMALRKAADLVMKTAWENGQYAAVLTAIQNATVDDPSGAVHAQIKALTGQRPIPTPVTLTWKRRGADGVMRNSSLTIDVAMSARPSLKTSFWGPVLICWFPGVCPWCCWGPVPGWGGGGGNESAGEMYGEDPFMLDASGYTVPAVPGFWSGLAGVFKLMTIGSCGLVCFPIIIPLGAFGLGPPGGINNGNGVVTVTVTHRRQGGSNLRFWTMRDPGPIVSQARARHTEADTSFGIGGDPGAHAELVGVL